MDTAQNTQITLLANGSATSNAVPWVGGMGIFTATATFGGGTVKLQYRTPDLQWVDAGTDTTLTANGGGAFILPKGILLRCNVATATAVTAYVIPLST